MDIHPYIDEKKSAVTSYLHHALKQDTLRIYSGVNRWGNDSIQRILTLATKGKMLRSVFVSLGHELITPIHDEMNLLHASGAIELCHTGFLIQDDVMDHDTMRRGEKSIHIQYQHILEQSKTRHVEDTAASLSTCVGDAAMFLGMHLLSDIKPASLGQDLLRLYSQEYTIVGIAQMQDVYAGASSKDLTKEEILSVYAYKTGRYSVALPLVTGATIAGAPEETKEKLWKLGTAIGILYQIRDDYLNLFGEEQKTGKPIGSDIREGKQTLYRHFLLAKSTGETHAHIQALFGTSTLTPDDLSFIRHQIQTCGVEEEIDAIVQKQTASITEILSRVPFAQEGKEKVQSIIDLVIKRES